MIKCEDKDDSEESKPKWKALSYDKESSNVEILLSDEIHKAFDYADLSQFIQCARHESPVILNIKLHLSGTGGDLSGLMYLVDVLGCGTLSTYVTAYIHGHVCSAHAMLACAAHEIVCEDYVHMMHHGVQFAGDGLAGPASSCTKYRAITQKLGEMFLNKWCSNILTKKEIKGMTYDELEVHLSGIEVKKRQQKYLHG